MTPRRSPLKPKTSSLGIEDGNDNTDLTTKNSSMLGTASASGESLLVPTFNVKSSSSSSSSSSNASFLYAVIFFFCMIVMELTLEGANNAFMELQALPYAVTLFQFAFCFFLPLVTTRGKSMETFPKTFVQCIPYISLSLVVFGSTFLASLSVRYVSYPTKVVVKSSKLIPTMIVATFLQQQQQSPSQIQVQPNEIHLASGGLQEGGSRPSPKYGVLDYVSAVLICAGAAGFGIENGADIAGYTSPSSTSTGMCCLLVSVFCDAFTPNIQQRLMSPPAIGALGLPISTTVSETKHLLPRSTTNPVAAVSTVTTIPANSSSRRSFCHSCCGPFSAILSSLFFPSSVTKEGGEGLGLSAQELMTNANGVGCIGLVVFMTLSGSLFETIEAAIEFPFLLVYLTIIGLALSTAVLCYTRLIQESGSVVAVAVATLRKVVTVILSYIVYPKAIRPIHVFSGIFVLGGILLSNYSKQQQHRRQRSIRER